MRQLCAERGWRCAIGCVALGVCVATPGARGQTFVDGRIAGSSSGSGVRFGSALTPFGSPGTVFFAGSESSGSTSGGLGFVGLTTFTAADSSVGVAVRSWPRTNQELRMLLDASTSARWIDANATGGQGSTTFTDEAAILRISVPTRLTGARRGLLAGATPDVLMTRALGGAPVRSGDLLQPDDYVVVPLGTAIGASCSPAAPLTQRRGALDMLFAQPTPCNTMPWSQPEVPAGSMGYSAVPSQLSDPLPVFDPVTGMVIFFKGSVIWGWDGSAWRRLSTTFQTNVPLTGDVATCYDADRQRIVLTNGAQVYEWNGQTLGWIGVTPQFGATPGLRTSARMAYDPIRKRCVFFGGSNVDNSTWEWDGVRWTLGASTGPAPRFLHAMCYYPPLGKVIMSGGTANNFSSFPTGTWAWTGSAWQSVPIPSVCWGSSLVWNPQTQQLVNVGRTSCGGSWTSAFAWNGSTWVDLNWTEPNLFTLGGVWDDARQEVLAFGPEHYSRRKFGRWQRLASPAPGPRARAASAMNGNGELVVFGGDATTTTTTYTSETWVRDGQTGAWRVGADSSAPRPSARSGAAMAYDAARGQYVLFGGNDAVTTSTDTWIYEISGDGTGFWSVASPVTSPPARTNATLARDPENDVLVLFGGRNAIGLPLNDTWTWDGTTWTQVGGAAPPARFAHAMATNEGSSEILLFGGLNPASPILVRNDLWRYYNGTWTQLVADGAPNNLPRMWGSGMAYDPIRRAVVLDGGIDDAGNLIAQTWFWNTRSTTSAWNQIGTFTNGRTARREHVFAIHPETGKYFTLGGRNSTAASNNTTGEQLIAPSAVAGFITGTPSVPLGQTLRLELFEHPGSAGGPHGIYRWYRNGQLLGDGVQLGGSVVSGSASTVLTISRVSSGDIGAYQCVYWGAECPTWSGYSEFFQVQVTPATSYLATPDSAADKVVLLDPTSGAVVNANWITDANNPGTYDFLEPIAAVQVDSELWVSDLQQSKVYRFTCSQQPQFLASIDVASPRGMCVRGGIVYIVSGTASAGTQIVSFNTNGTPTFSAPIAITGGYDITPYTSGLLAGDGTFNRIMFYPLDGVSSPFRFDAATTINGPRQVLVAPANASTSTLNVWAAGGFGAARVYQYAIPTGSLISSYGSAEQARGLRILPSGNFLFTRSTGLFRATPLPGTPTSLATGNFQLISPITILPNDGCDAIDFNRDGLFPDSGDLDDFIAVLAGGPGACSTFPSPGCGDIDFNNDQLFPDASDLDAFLSRLAGGPCVRP